MNKSERLKIAKARALEKLSTSSPYRAFDVFVDELSSHPETKSHSSIRRGLHLILNDELRTHKEMQEFICKCN